MERLGLCLKNLGRHGWRTRVILFIALFGAFLTFVSENIIEDIAIKQSNMFGRSSIGHFRVLNAGIETKNSFGYYYYEPDEMMGSGEIESVKAFLATIPEITGSRERIVFNGVYYNDEDAERGFTGIAMDMADFDRDFTDLYYAKGERVEAGESDACAASWYDYEEQKSLSIGDRYVFLLPNRNGEFVDRFIDVKGGIDFRTMPKETMGLNAMYFDLEGFRKTVGYDESAASEIIGFLADSRDLGKVLDRIEAFLTSSHPELKVVSWQEYAPIMAEMVIGFDIMMKTVETILITICVLLVVKLTTFSIIERYSEIGTMRALGFTRSEITLQFTLEGFLVIAAGAVAGMLLGAAFIGLLHQTGVRNGLTFFAYVIGNGFSPSFHADKIARVSAVFAAVAALAPLLPAIRGGRLSILQTLEKR